MLESWKSDHDIGYPYPNATGFYNGSAGTYEIYIEQLDQCIIFDFEMNLPRPDSFVPWIVDGEYAGRECHQGFWADRYTVPIGGDYGNFDAWFHIDTVYPLEFRGQTIPSVTAHFLHTDMVPIFDYTTPSDPDSADKPKPVFFPDFIGSWQNLTSLFDDFNSYKGNCTPVGDFLLMQNDFDALSDSEFLFERLREETEGIPEWFRFKILQHHALDLINRKML